MPRGGGRPVFWRWTTETQMVAERGSGIIVPEQPTPLQFRHDPFDKDFEGTREMARQDHESIGGTRGKPFFQDVRNLCRGAADGPVPSCRSWNIVQVAKRHVFATRTIQQGLCEALSKIGLGQLRDRSIQIVA